MTIKREKAEDFIGWKSDDGLLEVVGIYGKKGRGEATFKVICQKCKEDKELFPLGYFVSTKGHLVRGKKPCGCSKNTKWTKGQFLVLAQRAAPGRFIVHGFAEEFHGVHTKLNLECLIDGFKWTASVHNIVNGSGCSKCKYKTIGNTLRIEDQEAMDKCTDICKTKMYTPLGFPKGYKNKNSMFEYECPTHGVQNVSYSSFVYGGTGCKYCWKERQKELGNGNGYYAERRDEQDFLYILDFNGKFLKVGRSFDVDERIDSLRSLSKIKNIYKIKIFTATHQEIYDIEQELHKKLRERGFQYYLDWTRECFENECLFVLDNMLNVYKNLTEL